MNKSVKKRKNPPYNLIIAGVGGQGINTLAKVLAECLQQSGYYCQFTIHKGGAQSLGSVYTEFRISRTTLAPLGQGIPQGELDSLVALEPWEAVRHMRLANTETTLWVEEEIQPLFVERRTERVIPSAKSQLNLLPIPIYWKSYQHDALERFKNKKMANYLAGLDCLIALKINNLCIDPTLFDTLFFSRIKKANRS